LRVFELAASLICRPRVIGWSGHVCEEVKKE